MRTIESKLPIPIEMTTTDEILPPEIAALLAGVPETTEEMLEELANANRKLNNDPDFLADVERARFVNEILNGMNEGGVNMNQLANRIGKSRQYVHKVLDEDNRVSFTLKTMVALCHALGKRFKVSISDRKDSCAQKTIVRPRLVQGSLKPDTWVSPKSSPSYDIDISAYLNRKQSEQPLPLKSLHHESRLSA
tara:strand:- start:145 stop:723 length:579 start_codon:yes stop_codon:yes gene_type:complete